MAEKQINGRIVHKHDTEANWNKATNFIPKNGEIIIYDPDSTYSYARVKVGNGSTVVTSLPFIDNAIKTVQTNLSDTVDSVKNNSITALSVSGRTITYTKGDGTTGTITTQDNNTTYSAGTGLSLSGTTFNHTNSVTAATAQGDASKTLAFGGTFTIPTITYDAQGHITGKDTTTMTMPVGPVAKEGNPVSEIGIAGAGFSAETTFEPKQEGSGEPSPDNIRPITGWTGAGLTRCGKNLLGVDFSAPTAKSGTTTKAIGSGVRVTSTDAASNYTWARWITSIPIESIDLVGKTFTLSCQASPSGDNTPQMFMSVYDAGGVRVGTSNFTPGTGKLVLKYTITESDVAHGNRLGLTLYALSTGTAGSGVYSEYTNVQIELGSTATAYEPYQGDTYAADFGQTVYGGTLDWNTGVLTVEWKLVELNGAESWNDNGTNAYYLTNYASVNTDSVISNTFHTGTDYNIYKISVAMNVAAALLVFYHDGSQYATKDEWKSYLAAKYAAGTPVQVCYKLATPTTLQLTPYDLRMLDGINNVYSDGDTNYAIFNSGASSLAQVDKNYLKLTGGTITGALYIKNSPIYPCIYFRSSSYPIEVGGIYYSVSNDSTNSHFWFQQFSRSSTDYSLLTNYEQFNLPSVNADRTSSASYAILTTKSAVTIAQGGTGATTASGARTNLEVPSKTGDGASGTWGISITGNAATATQLATARTIQTNLGSTSSASFNGTENITPGVTGTLPVANGGTGKTTGMDACNYFINSLSTASSTPGDNDYFISQYVSGGTTTTTYHRRPISTLYSYIKGKTDSLYLPLSGGTITGDFYIKNSSTWPNIRMKSTSYSDKIAGIIYETIRSDSAVNYLGFRTYSRSSSDYSLLDYYENFELPSTSSNRTSNAIYYILTTKSAVTIAQGGTGATTAAGIVANIKTALVDTIYPVGSIYITMSETTPATLFGGTWERIEGSFLLGAHANAVEGDGYVIGEYGGESEHTLTTDEIPPHSHYVYKNTNTEGDWGFMMIKRNGHARTQVATSSSSGKYTITNTTNTYLDWPYCTRTDVGTRTSGTTAHNNMPPYIAVYIWKRTA